jgi:hypothetical protein
MILLWMMYAVLVGGLTALGAIAVERAARLARLPVRWAWLGAIGFAIGLAMHAPEPGGAASGPAFDLAASDSIDAGASSSGSWLAAARLQIAGGARWLDVARVIRAVGGTAIGRVDDRYAIAVWVALSAMLAFAFVIVHARLGLARSRWPRVELHDAPVRLSPRIGPATIGLWRPEIVVPAWLLGRSSVEQRMAIAHESSHNRARDPQLLSAAWIALILFPWNAALWLMVSRLRLAIEIDCDRRVLRGGVSPGTYGSLLLAVAELASPLRPSALALADDSSHLKTRILAMDARLPKFGRFRAALATLIGAVAVLAACEAKEPTAADVDAMTVASAEKAARQIGVLHAADTGVAYTIDSVRVSPEAAQRLGVGDIVTMTVRRNLNAAAEVAITTRRDSVRRERPGSGEANVGYAVLAPPPAPGDTTVAWFINDVRVDYTEVRRLDGNNIESVEVLKGPAAAAYGTPFGQKVVAIRLKRESRK